MYDKTLFRYYGFCLKQEQTAPNELTTTINNYKKITHILTEVLNFLNKKSGKYDNI